MKLLRTLKWELKLRTWSSLELSPDLVTPAHQPLESSQYAKTPQSLISRLSSPDRQCASEQTEETELRRLQEVMVMIERCCLTSDCCWRRSHNDGR